MKTFLLRKRLAITSVELIITVLIITFVFAAAIAMIITSMKLFKTELSESIMTDDLSVTLEWIKKDAMCSDNVDITTANEITMDLEDFSVSPPVSYQVRYYVKNSTELYRQILGSGSSEKMITDLIDAGNLPVFTQPADSNYLLAEICVRDTAEDITAHQDTGVMLRCRRTAP